MFEIIAFIIIGINITSTNTSKLTVFLIVFIVCVIFVVSLFYCMSVVLLPYWRHNLDSITSTVSTECDKKLDHISKFVTCTQR